MNLLYEDKREIHLVNDNAAQVTYSVGRQGITKIEVYPEHGERDWIGWLAVWKGDFLWVRTSTTNKDIIYKQPC